MAMNKIETNDWVIVIGGERDGLVGRVDNADGWVKDGVVLFPVIFYDEDGSELDDFVYATEIKLYKKGRK